MLSCLNFLHDLHLDLDSLPVNFNLNRHVFEVSGHLITLINVLHMADFFLGDEEVDVFKSARLAGWDKGEALLDGSGVAEDD